MRLIERRELAGTAEIDGVRREVGLMLCPEANVGGFVLVHAGYAIGTIDEDEALKTLALLREAASGGAIGEALP
jgi:hydrogenase expression/formation protein HypC